MCIVTDISQATLLASRLLLLLTGLVLALMPLSEHLWNWDRFLHGGQDLELGLFTALSLVLLSLLLAQPLMQSSPLAMQPVRRHGPAQRHTRHCLLAFSPENPVRRTGSQLGTMLRI
ncbi:hypothetical protein D1Y84_07535 [Acidipila sp. EB88]|nr:hypothetical protein D1Y84_07535 [Acidipila sp. EB88]